MNRDQLKKIIEEEAKLALNEAGIKQSSEIDDITPDQIKKLAEECKKINSSLDFRSPIIDDEKLIAESNSTQEGRWAKLIEYKVFNEDNEIL